MAITIVPVSSKSPSFQDALYVRFNVFTDEQQIPADIEIDDDEDRSFHWVVYTDEPSRQPRAVENPKLAPVGTCRIVPVKEGSGEEFIHLGRMAVVKDYRRKGLSRLLMDTALEFATAYPEKVVPASEGKWDGRVNIGAQVQAMPAWVALGFVHDPTLGEWDEGGVPHRGMWKTVELETINH